MLDDEELIFLLHYLSDNLKYVIDPILHYVNSLYNRIVKKGLYFFPTCHNCHWILVECDYQPNKEFLLTSPILLGTIHGGYN